MPLGFDPLLPRVTLGCGRLAKVIGKLQKLRSRRYCESSTQHVGRSQEPRFLSRIHEKGPRFGKSSFAHCERRHANFPIDGGFVPEHANLASGSFWESVQCSVFRFCNSIGKSWVDKVDRRFRLFLPQNA
jgi:hypothetical protein